MAGPEGGTGALEISDLRVTTADGREILRIDHLVIAAGDTVALRGPSGAGKSTLLYAIAGLVPKATGAVRWAGRDLLSASDAARTRFRRETVGFVFQEHLLFEDMPTLANAGIGALYASPARRAGIRERAAAALEAFGLAGATGQAADTLSGGERQRVAVARALASDPQVLLADEPTAALDRANADRVAIDLFDWAAAGGRTLIVVSHDASVLERAGRVIELRHGRMLGVVADA